MKVAVSRNPSGGWRWQCKELDGPRALKPWARDLWSAWHYDKDDCGSADTHAEAIQLAVAHLKLHDEAQRTEGWKHPSERALQEIAETIAAINALVAE